MRKATVPVVTLVVATALNLSLAQANEETSLINLSAGIGVLGVVLDEHSPVLGAKVNSDTLPTVSIWLSPGAELIRKFDYARFFRVSAELGVTQHTVCRWFQSRKREHASAELQPRGPSVPK